MFGSYGLVISTVLPVITVLQTTVWSDGVSQNSQCQVIRRSFYIFGLLQAFINEDVTVASFRFLAGLRRAAHCIYYAAWCSPNYQIIMIRLGGHET